MIVNDLDLGRFHRLSGPSGAVDAGSVLIEDLCRVRISR